MTALADAPAPASPPDRRLPTWRERILPPLAPLAARGGWLATLLVVLVGGALRFVRLDLPHAQIFDEQYYACDAQNLLRYGVEHDHVENDLGCIPRGGGAFIVHPPLGKWLIALGEKAFGYDTLGWRFAAAVAGTLTILVVVRVGRRMTGSTLLGCLAGLLLSLDGLHLVQSRVAMLDVFLVLFTTAAFACLVVDRDQVRRRLAELPDEVMRGAGPRLGRRPWRLLAGVCLGAALSTKWSALYYVAVLVLLSLTWEVGARRTAGVRAPVRATLVRSALPALGVLVLVPAVLYVVSWTGWFLSDVGYDRHWAADNPSGSLVPDALRSWWHYHREIYHFHSTLSVAHRYQSHPVGWLLLARPVSYYYPSGIVAGQYGCTVAACSREVLDIGTPAIWWAGIPLVVALLWMWLARRDWRAAALLTGIAAAIVPWFRDDLKHRTMFLFYALPAVPFMALGLALVAGWVVGGPEATARRRTWGAAAVGAYLAVVVLDFAWMYPVLAAQTLPYARWYARMWFSSWV